MGEEEYKKLVERISKASGLSVNEVEMRVEAKRNKLSGLISKEGAAQIISAELGISLDQQRVKIGELLPQMSKVNVFGKVLNIFPVREFERDGKKNKVANLVIADETGNTKVVLWDTNHIKLIEENKLGDEDVIEIVNGSVRNSEIHLGSFSELKKSHEVINEVMRERSVREKSIAEFRPSDIIKTRAFVVQAFPPRFFEINPLTSKKITDDEKSRGVVPEKRALINIVLDDGSETIRGVLFHEMISKLGLNDLEDAEKLSAQKEELIGKEFLFFGNVKMNSFFNEPELSINRVEEVDLDEILNGL